MVVFYIGCLFYFILAGYVEAAQEPCSQIAKLAGEVIDFISYDYNVYELTQGHNEEFLESLANYGQEYTRDEVNFWSPEERENLVCSILNAKKFDDVWNLVKTENLPQQVTRDVVCYYYQAYVHEMTAQNILNVTRVEAFSNFVESFGQWLIDSGFPSSWPIYGEHTDNVEKLKEFRSYLVKDSATNGMTTDLLPIGTIYSYNYDYQNESTRLFDLEQLVSLLEDSKNIFQYVSQLEGEEDLYYSLGSVSESVNMFELWRYNFDKAKWLVDGLKALLKTNIFHLDTSTCVYAYDPENSFGVFRSKSANEV